MNKKSHDLVLTKGQVALHRPDGEMYLSEIDIGIQNGMVQALGSNLKGARVVDLRGLTVIPGPLDTQVHLREPGNELKETISSGTRAAIMGGITGVFEMPNTTPPTVSAIDLQDKITRAQKSWCDIAFYMGATQDNLDRLQELEELPGCCGIKVFMGSSTGTLLLNESESLKKLLSTTRRRSAFHCEDEARLKMRRHLAEESASVFQHPQWRDEIAALQATTRIVEFAKAAGHPVHILHVSSAEEIEFLSQQPKPLVSVECTPQHLTLWAPECYENLGTLAQMNPPIREKRHRDALWRGIENGTVDIIGSDHAPHTLEEKKKAYPQSPSGMPGVQTLLPLMLDHMNAGRISLKRLLELLVLNPCRLFGIKGRGVITPGVDATFTVVDLKRFQEIQNSWIESRCGWTPFHGLKVKGWPIMTILRGQILMRDGELLGPPQGRILEFKNY